MMYLDGKFQITPPLQGNHLAYLARFAQIRHMTWDVTLLENLRDPLREAVGLPLGVEGAYYVAVQEIMPLDPDPAIITPNRPPNGQPALWCCWEPSGDGESYVWANGEKNYGHKSWLEYLIAHFFKPWHYQLSGQVECSYHFCKYVYLNDDEEDDENRVEIRCVKKSELIVKDDNLVIENVLGTFKDERGYS
jgi:hypothetical protein